MLRFTLVPLALMVALMGVSPSLARAQDQPIQPDELARLLEDDDPEVRHRALAGLAGDTPVADEFQPLLRQALNDEDRDVRQMAAIALVNSGLADQPILDELIRGLARTWLPRYYVSPQDALAAQWALERLGAPAVPALVAAIEDEDFPGWSRAVAALGHIGPASQPALPRLEQALADRDRPDFTHIVHAKWQIDGDADYALRELMPLLDTPRGRSCAGAVRILALMGADARDAVPALIAALRKYRDDDEVANVAWALGELAPHKLELALPALIESLGDRHAAIEAAPALSSLGVPADQIVAHLVEALDRWKNHEGGPHGIVMALEPFGPEAKAAVPVLIPLLKHPNIFLRWQAARTLGKIGPDAQEALPALRELLADDYSTTEAGDAIRRIQATLDE